MTRNAAEVSSAAGSIADESSNAHTKEIDARTHI